MKFTEFRNQYDPSQMGKKTVQTGVDNWTPAFVSLSLKAEVQAKQTLSE